MNPARTTRISLRLIGLIAIAAIVLAVAPQVSGQSPDPAVVKKLGNFDAYMAKVLKDWNAPGIGVGIVKGDKLVFAKGYGFRDYGQKLPYSPATLQQMASNTKLFTAIAAGMLVEEGKLTWDKPVRESVPSIKFYNNELDNTVTLRDMLSHRTGITRHDTIWYQSDDTRKQLFDKVRYLEPQEPLRQTFLYNNLMYAAAGYIIELQSGRPWEEFVRERIFKPLEMTSTVYSISDMLKAAEPGVPYTEKRDTFELYKIPYYEDIGGVAPCGAIISNIQDMSHWLIALMNDGRYNGKQVLPPAVLKATLEPAISLPNTAAEVMGFWEALNATYGMGRETVSYRGQLLTMHGGDLPGFHSQVSFLPKEKLGVLVFVIGDHCASLYNTVSYNVYERLLGLDQTPWSERQLELRLKNKKAGTEARAKAGADRVPNTKPSHALADYAGEYEHPAYGILKVELKDGGLRMDFHKIRLPLSHFHYDRFETPNDETYGRTAINFQTNPQGDVDKAVVSLDEAEVTFTRRPTSLSPETLAQLAGSYELPNGVKIQVVLKEGGALILVVPGDTDQELVPYKGLVFRIKLFADVTFEFLMDNGKVTGLRQRDPGGEYVFPRK
jgi:CubicO group peptidase (beta-lactamase class C family)